MECDETVEEIDSFLKNLGVRRRAINDTLDENVQILNDLGIGQRPIDDPLLEDSHNVCKVFEKQGVVIEDEEELCHTVMKVFQCHACEATFQNLLDYEMHYQNIHHFVCAQCKKSRPTARLLEIHILETHDSFFKVLSEKQPMYQCFVDACNLKFNNPVERREHCREIHKFPKHYRFDEIHSDKENKKSEESMEICENEAARTNDFKVKLGKKSKQKTFTNKCLKLQNVDNKSIVSPEHNVTADISKSSVTMFVPRQVQLHQKSYARLLTQNQDRETNVLETDSLMELKDSLPND